MKRIMKKIYAFMVAAIALTAVSCNNEAIDEVVGGENIVNGDYITTLAVGLDNTRTQYSEGKTIWTAGDEISLNGSVYELTDGANSGNGTFSLKEGQTPILAGLDNYIVMYPANCNYNIPTAQTAVAGSFDPKAAVLGTSVNGLEGLTLCPYHALVKFTVAADSQSVSLLGYTLEGTITAGETYYIAVNPTTYAGLTAVLDGVAYKSTISPIVLGVCDVLNIGTLEGTDVYLAGTYNTWNSTANMMMKEGNYYVAKGITDLCASNGADMFKLVIGGEWFGEKNNENMAPHYMYSVHSAGNGGNFTGWGIDAVTSYNVYYLPETNQVTVRNAETTLSIVGSFISNAQGNWQLDANIPLTLNNGWFVAQNVTIPAGAEWKICVNNSWDLSFGGAALTAGTYIHPNAGAPGNFTIAEGTYDIYVSEDTFNMVVVNAGSPRP